MNFNERVDRALYRLSRIYYEDYPRGSIRDMHHAFGTVLDALKEPEPAEFSREDTDRKIKVQIDRVGRSKPIMDDEDEPDETLVRQPDGRVWIKSMGGHPQVWNGQITDRYIPVPESHLTPAEAFRPGALARWTHVNNEKVFSQAYIQNHDNNSEGYVRMMGNVYQIGELTLVAPAPEEK